MIKFQKNRRLEEAGKTNDPLYCLFHQNIQHPIKKCYNLKDGIQALIEAGILQLKLEQKKVSANMATLVIGSNEFPIGATSMPVGKLYWLTMTRIT